MRIEPEFDQAVRDEREHVRATMAHSLSEASRHLTCAKAAASKLRDHRSHTLIERACAAVKSAQRGGE